MGARDLDGASSTRYGAGRRRGRVMPEQEQQEATRRRAGARSRRPRAVPERAGQLKAADPFDLIRLLARSQHDPRKAVAELVQNSLDAGARRVLITRYRHRGRKILAIRDDGEGVLRELGRQEALSYIATHIGRSRKRDLSLEERYRLLLQGKYGIGLLGFWSVGHIMEMRTKVGADPVCVLRLEEDSPRYEIHTDREQLGLEEVWTEVQVIDLHETAVRQLAGRRLADYLAEELRGQLLEREVELRIVDHLARGRAQREFRVVPRRFKGVPLGGLAALEVPGHHRARLELYYVAPELEEPGRVVLSAGGTLVVEDLAALPGLDHPPWSSGRLAGLVDFAALDVAPGSRRGFVPNEAAAALTDALLALEPELLQLLARFEEERQRESDSVLVKQLRRLFADFGRRLPHYELFEVQEPEQLPAGAAADAEPGGQALAAGDELAPRPTSGEQAPLLPPGPLAALEIQPREAVLEIGQSRPLHALARDADGRRIDDGSVAYEWSIESGAGLGALAAPDPEEPRRARLQAGESVGELVVAALARQGALEARATATVEIVEALATGRDELGIPHPYPVHAPAERWRSRMAGGRWEYNSGHPDYLATVEDPRRKLRYIVSLLAKELVLRGAQQPGAAVHLEQMVEVLAWAERRMPRG
jgi:hypothetical protein